MSMADLDLESGGRDGSSSRYKTFRREVDRLGGELLKLTAVLP